jgi:hypothetical protein
MYRAADPDVLATLLGAATLQRDRGLAQRHYNAIAQLG